MAKVSVCDVCRRPTKRLVLKLWLSPRASKGNSDRRQYIAHADVGECCAAKMNEIVNWQKRVSGQNGRKRQQRVGS